MPATRTTQLSRRAVAAVTIGFSLALATPLAALAKPEPVIPVIVKDTTAQYWQIVIAGAKAAGKALHVRVPAEGAQSESDIAGQITVLENAVSQNPAAIVIAPTQFTALGAPITQAASSVKIIGIDSPVKSDALTSFLSTDNVKAGKEAADALGAAVKAKTGADKGDVALITALPGVGSLDQRASGFKDELAAKFPDLKLVASKVADGQPTTGLNITTDLLTSNPNLVGIYASNLPMSQGASEAVAENHPAKLSLICGDSDDKLVHLLKSGVVSALIVQNPYRMGYEGVKIALEASEGKPVPKQIDTGVTVITQANVNTPKAQALLNPKL
ncbi:MAG: ABC transporter substrate-binding protein [Rhodospirillales bacterium 20-64-7]|nr:MAG: ABC transporter substrate-binding protein [Rhodospirillales bacterium 20-64-7]